MLLLLKLTLVPLLIWGISRAGRIWGPSVAGWLSAFPVVTGPILFFIGLEHGEAFAAAAASSTVMAITAHLSFGLAYAWAATRLGWRTALPLGLTGYGLCLAALGALQPWAVAHPAWVAVLLPCVLLVARRLFPSVDGTLALPAGRDGLSMAQPRVEMTLRMTAGAALVLLVTWLAGRAGPQWSGLLAMFPVLGVVLAVFSHRQTGAAFVITLLRDMVWGYFAFFAFCMVLARALPGRGLVIGFAGAVGAALLVQMGSLRVMRRGR